MKGLKKLSLILVCIMGLSTITIANAPAPPLPLMYVDPEENSVNPGGSFTIDINIQNADDIFTYETKLGYNRELLQITGIKEGPFIKDQTTSPMGTLWATIDGPNWVYAVCATLGNYPGISGSGNLFNITFNVLDSGASDLDLFNSIMLNSTGAILSHDVADGYFYTPAEANLVRRSAWPEHHRFDISKDEDFNGTHANQTLSAKVKNLSPVGWNLKVKVMFRIVRDDGFVTAPTTEVRTVAPGEIVELSANLMLAGTDTGRYYTTVKCIYSLTGGYWTQGAKTKTFSFTVVP